MLRHLCRNVRSWPFAALKLEETGLLDGPLLGKGDMQSVGSSGNRLEADIGILLALGAATDPKPPFAILAKPTFCTTLMSIDARG